MQQKLWNLATTSQQSLEVIKSLMSYEWMKEIPLSSFR